MPETFGARLRRRREERQIDLITIAKETKIKPLLLEGLERDDVSDWPSGLYRRAFIRAYAQAIDLDPDLILREFLDVHPERPTVDVLAAMASALGTEDKAARPATSPVRNVVDLAIGSLSRLRRCVPALPILRRSAQLAGEAAPPSEAPAVRQSELPVSPCAVPARAEVAQFNEARPVDRFELPLADSVVPAPAAATEWSEAPSIQQPELPVSSPAVPEPPQLALANEAPSEDAPDLRGPQPAAPGRAQQAPITGQHPVDHEPGSPVTPCSAPVSAESRCSNDAPSDNARESAAAAPAIPVPAQFTDIGEAPAPLVLEDPVAPHSAPAAVEVAQSNEAPVGPPQPARPVSSEPDLLDVAHLCTEFSLAGNAHEVQPLLQRASTLLNATGLIVWLWDPSAAELKPALVHGYSHQVIARLPRLRSDADNATALAFRSAQLCAIPATENVSGALVIPLLTPEGCAGVLAIELRRRSEQTNSTRAVATILAALLAQMTTHVGPPAGERRAVSGRAD